MGQITLNQSHQVLATLAKNTDWATIDFVNLGLQDLIVRNPKEAGRQFTAFLKNGGKLILVESKVISIVRGVFNPIEFHFTINGKIEGWGIYIDKIEEIDTRFTALMELDLTKVELRTMLKGREVYVNGEEKLRRLKKGGYIRLDADVFHTLWQNQHLIPESWKEKVDGYTRYIIFDGTIFRSLDGCLCIPELWCGPLERRWGARHPSAVLAS